MAYPAGSGALRSPREDTFAFRNAAGTQIGSSNDVRGQLHRRFTTNNIPTLSTPLSPIGLQRRQAAEPAEFTTAVRTISLLYWFGLLGWDWRRSGWKNMCAEPPVCQFPRCALSCIVSLFAVLDYIRGESDLGLTDQS
ncbi:hypothetical protein GQ44DRAFT_706371 [Phaeosphaeriaceae sp. PMI808]|nr:hypothetical protein GQ44DRAFT_706371 [Phaeosphaeriaceae sp. PMI808]